MKAQELMKKVQELALEAAQFSNSEEMARYMEAMARFHNYSFDNSMLIATQRADASRVAGYRRWQEHGRHVRKGAKGIAILCPCAYRRKDDDESEVTAVRFKVGYVFDISHTEGKPVPELSDITTGDDNGLLARLEALAKSNGITVTYTDNGGAIRGTSTGGAITVEASLPAAMKAKVLAHEIAHEVLH